MANEPIKEDCKMCGINYDAQVYEHDYEARWADYMPQQCPNCEYHPGIEKLIMDLIDKHAAFTLNTSRKNNIKVNAQKLTNLIVEHTLKRFWPKKQKK